MRQLIAIALLIASIGTVSAAPVLEGGDPLSERPNGDPIPPPWRFAAGAGGELPDGLSIGGRPVAVLSVYPQGVLVLDAAGFNANAPRPLDELRMASVIAPFWSTLAVDACPARARGVISRVIGPSSLTVIWRDVPIVGCPAGSEAATFSVELTWDAQAIIHRIELRFEHLPSETPAVEPRAGLRLRGAAPLVFELLPDLEAGPLRGRAKRLLEGSSDGEAGAWIIELDAAAQVVGDPDLDGWRSIDNCEDDFNPLQENLDGDAQGDVCDRDIDGDGHFEEDNCPRVPNPDLSDLDRDGQGDVCDEDDDGDGVPDGLDRCPRVPDPANLDLDRDGIGDACDPDPDGDNLAAGRIARDALDLCPWAPDPLGGDADGDRLGDVCDLRPWLACRGLGCLLQADADGDGVGDVFDGCPRTPDPAQRDVDGDGIGDVCDADINGDGVLDLYQFCSLGACVDLDPTRILPRRRR